VGFLGQCLASEGCCEAIIQTETNEVLIHLERTLKSNGKALDEKDVTAHLLDWTNYDTEIAKLSVQTFDTILATDVLFAPNLVEPLLKTAAKVSNDSTVWFLCVQKRCSKSHDLFLRQAPEFGFLIEDLSDSLDEWGKAVDCVLLRLTRIPEKKTTSSKQSAFFNKRPKLK
jgi:Lysine methyltransferase